MATADQIPTDLTLELNGDVSPERFLTAARAFFGCVQETTKAMVAEGDPPGWKVVVKEGSNLLGLVPDPAANSQIVKAVYAQIQSGINLISLGLLDDAAWGNNPAWGPAMPEPAIQHLKTLADLAVAKGKRGPVDVRVWVEKHPSEIGPQISKIIAESLGENYRDYGAVEGKLDAIQERSGLQIRVFDQLLRQAVICHVEDEMLSDVFAKFRKRVEVTGVVHYRRDGRPISIDVENIEELPDDDDLPTAADVRGILAS